MGDIYIIKNTKNNNVYIGQSVFGYEERWKEHQRNYQREYWLHLEIYTAMREIGIENFFCECLETDICEEELNDREMFWIDKYNSYQNGYNMTLGGNACRTISQTDEEIIYKYRMLKSARKTAEYYGIDHSTVDKILNKNNIKRFSPAQQKGISCVLEKDGQELCFDSFKDAGRYLVESGIADITLQSARKGLSRSCRSKKQYYGYYIRKKR